VDDYERATARVAQLAGDIESRSAERELEALTGAMMEWDKHLVKGLSQERY
jgi:hypothetical protein